MTVTHGIRRSVSVVGTLAVAVVSLVLAAPPSQADPADISFPTFFSIAVGAAPRAVAAGSLNGDSHLDLVTANAGANSVTVLLGQGTGFGYDQAAFATGLEPTALALADVDGNTTLDVVTSNVDSENISVLLGDGTGGFSAHADFAVGFDPGALAVGDLDGDGAVDVVSANYGADTVSVLLGDGLGGFAARTDYSTGAVPTGVALADLDGDTDLDVATADSGTDGVSVLFGNGLGGLGPAAAFAAGDHPSSIRAVDADGDAVSDLVTASFASNTVSLLVGDGAGGFGAPSVFATGLEPTSVTLADLDGDLGLDIITTNHGSDTVSVLRGDGAGGFVERTDWATNDGPWSVAVGDLNNDGLSDMAVAADNLLSVLLQTPLTAPGAPTIIRNATAGHQSATVSWTAPVSNGGSAITGYVVTPYVGYYGLTPTTFTSTVTTQTITGLANGTTYRFRVQAVNAMGTSGYSKVTNVVTPEQSAPGAPTIIRNATAGDGQATVSWTAPVSDGGSAITGYVVTPYIGYFPLASRTFASTATTQTITGLTNGTQYRFRVQAINAVGTSGYSKVTNPVTPTA